MSKKTVRSVTYNFSPNALFRAGPNWELNACVGENGGPYDLDDYGHGFFDGAGAIVEAASDRRIPVDVAVYPAAFAFRHGIELYLKQFLRDLIAFTETNREIQKDHGIRDYMSMIADILAATSAEIADAAEVEIAKDIIADFDQIDPTGMVFRYPEDLKGNAHLTGLRLINMEVLNDGMTVLREIIERWIGHLKVLQEYKDEMKQEYKDEMNGWE